MTDRAILELLKPCITRHSQESHDRYPESTACGCAWCQLYRYAEQHAQALAESERSRVDLERESASAEKGWGETIEDLRLVGAQCIAAEQQRDTALAECARLQATLDEAGIYAFRYFHGSVRKISDGEHLERVIRRALAPRTGGAEAE